MKNHETSTQQHQKEHVMKTGKTHYPSGIGRTLLGALALVAMVAFGANQAQAATAGTSGNAIIRNIVTVAYTDAAGNGDSSTATVDVTVTTKDAAPTVVAISPSPGNTYAAGDTQQYTATIRTNSNGPGTISFSMSQDTSATAINFTTMGALPGNPASIFLGSTIIDPADANGAQTVADSGTITFVVPNDGGVPTDSATTGGDNTDNSVNGLTALDTAYVYDGTDFYGPFDVTTVVDNDAGVGTTAATNSITLTNNTGGGIALPNPDYGWMIVEAKDVNFTVTQGTITDIALAASWVTTINAAMGTPNTDATVTTNAVVGQVAVDKYVRNVTDGTVTGTTPITYPAGGEIYYKTGVSGKTEEVLEYLLVIENAGTGTVTAVTATDAVPVYTTLVTGASYGTGSGTIFAQISDDAGANAVNVTTGNDAETQPVSGAGNETGFGETAGGATAAGTGITFRIGTDSTKDIGGTITTDTYNIIYQVTID
jgi:hypothetical protein